VNPSERPVRNWLNEHPATATYTAFVVTLLLILQLGQTFHVF
jgi:hypothetical protein